MSWKILEFPILYKQIPMKNYMRKFSAPPASNVWQLPIKRYHKKCQFMYLAPANILPMSQASAPAYIDKRINRWIVGCLDIKNKEVMPKCSPTHFCQIPPSPARRKSDFSFDICRFTLANPLFFQFLPFSPKIGKYCIWSSRCLVLWSLGAGLGG